MGNAIHTGKGGTGLKVKCGEILNVEFGGGNPKKVTVTFITPFPDSDYAPQVVPQTINNATFSLAIEDVLPGSFVVNSGANNINNLVSVRFTATKFGETV